MIVWVRVRKCVCVSMRPHKVVAHKVQKKACVCVCEINFVWGVTEGAWLL